MASSTLVFPACADGCGSGGSPKITITVLPPRRLEVPVELRGRARRHTAGLRLYDIMSEMMARRPDPPSLFAALLETRRAQGGSYRILEDPTGQAMTYDRR